MNAVKDPDGREIVESLVIQAERSGRSPDLQTDENMGLLQIEWVIFVILRAIPVFDGDAIADW
jgi:hypothetical protein